jgi:catechol 2,3-dioxygenase-like lactoylglutathione lyase family enzyme
MRRLETSNKCRCARFDPPWPSPDGKRWVGHHVLMDPGTDPQEEVIPILRVQDAAAAARWYERLGFQLVNVHRFEPALPAFATIQRGAISLFLSEHAGDARPGTLIYLRVRDARALADKLGKQIDDNPWGEDFELTDPDGNRFRIGTPSWW